MTVENELCNLINMIDINQCNTKTFVLKEPVFVESKFIKWNMAGEAIINIEHMFRDFAETADKL